MFNDIAAVIATKDYATAWLQVVDVADPDGNEVSFVQDLRMS